MGDVIAGMVTAASFVPHGYCLLWRPDLIALHAVSDGLVALSYFAIPLILGWYVRKRPDIAGDNKHVAWLFVAFITACGLSHLAGLITLWLPIYEVQGLVKAATAVISLTTVAALVLILPSALKIPSVQALEAANQELRRLRDELERSADDRARALAVTSQRLEAAILGAPIVIASQDRTLTYNWVSQGAMGHGPGWFVGKFDAEVIPETVRDEVIAAKSAVIERGEPRRIEIDLPEEAEMRTFDVRIQPAHDADGAINGVITVAIDVTERKQREEQIKLLMRELAHRVKNIFAVVQAITRQTAAHTRTRDEFLERFGARLAALSSSHELLLDGSQAGVSLVTLVQRQLGHFGDLFGSQILIDGPDVTLRADASQAIGLALHELATNAVKYGALSVPRGVVTISWTLSDGSITLGWVERGGPPVTPATRQGFGRTVVERMVARAVRGDVSMAFEPSGLVWRLTFPLPAVLDDGPADPSVVAA